MVPNRVGHGSNTGSREDAGIVTGPKECRSDRDNNPPPEPERAPERDHEEWERRVAQDPTPWIGVAQPGCIVHPEHMSVTFSYRLFFYSLELSFFLNI
jgi:hypothetical protein